ncbi:MAG: PEP-CTERM sorting domain-containing protein, partial [bacterium]
PVGISGRVNALEFDGLGQLYVTSIRSWSQGELGIIDLVTRQTTVLGNIGYSSDGDLAFAPDGRLLLSSPVVSYGLITKVTNSRLVQVDPTAPAGQKGTSIGLTGFTYLHGMDFVGEELIGTTLAGELISIDTTTGAGTLRANMNPTVRAYGASYTEVVAPAPQERFKSHLPALADAKNLVLVTHGWNVSGSQGGETWVDEMARDIRAYIDAHRADAADWEVVVYDWRDLAGSLETGPDLALANGGLLGAIEGELLARRDYDHVHLVGNSAGAALVDSATDHIKARSPGTTVHITFLDAYAPGMFAGSYGDSADWADQYLNRGDSLWLEWTEEVLPHAHNVDVTWLNPTPSLIPLVNHFWPHEFYQESIVPRDEFEGYGFLLSREATVGAWNPGATYPIDTEVVLDPNPPPQPTPRPQLQVRFDSPTNFNLLFAATSGTDSVQVSGSALTLRTASPAWYVAGLTITEPINFLTADIEFTSDIGAEGLLAVYFDDSVVGLLDERFVLDGVQPYQFYLGEVEDGLHTLGFRLDSFTDIASSVVISNVRTGLTVVPEPSAIVLLATGIVTFLVLRGRAGR